MITGLILGLLTRYSHDMYNFLMNRMLGVTLTFPSEGDEQEYITIKIDEHEVKSKHGSFKAFFLWLIGTTTFTVALMVLYEGCILGNAGVYPGDACPSDPMTCFASSDNPSSSEVGTFQCTPGNITTFPDGTNKAWCYG